MLKRIVNNARPPRRFYSSIIDKKNLQELIKKEPNDFTLIDVRKINEVTGVFPLIKPAINIPLDELSSAFSLDPVAFKAKYNTNKPTKEDNVILYCKIGLDSEYGQKELDSLGYKNSKYYKGSAMDWYSSDADFAKCCGN
ncbi:Hsp67 [Acrasis kona]|uniref:Hsp67 n=1 Tax=Acrasis kona TaxID=1008807 RepID=A0AAW2ZCF7_9EUKA